VLKKLKDKLMPTNTEKQAVNLPAPVEIDDLRLIPMDGFNESTRTSQAIIWYKGRLIVGTGRSPLGFMGRFTASRGKGGLTDQGNFGATDSAAGARDEDGAEVWSYNPETDEWTSVFKSPVQEGVDGEMRARDRSIRAAYVYQTASDTEPTLYLGVGSLERQVVFLRSTDGINFEECKEHGFGLGDVDVPSVRVIVGMNGKLYCTPTGKNYGRGMFDDNLTDFPFVFETDDPLNGHWTPVNEQAFGDDTNISINELTVLNDHLYAMTINKRNGFQVWKTDAKGKPPYQWTKIVDRGAYRNISSFPSFSYVFNNAIYVGGTLQRQGRGGRDRFGPYPADIIRINADDSWDLVSGVPRFTPDGFKQPTTGTFGGLGEDFIHVFWKAAEHDGWLYLGAAGWKWMPTYLKDRPDLSEDQFAYLQEETDKYVEGHYPMWRTSDGETWEVVTEEGIPGANPHNYGIREILGTDYGLFVVPTNKLGANKGGGLEIWLGDKKKS